MPIDYSRTTKAGEQFRVQWAGGEIEVVQTPRDVFVLDPSSLHALVEFGGRTFAGPADLDAEVFVRALPRQGFVNNAQALQKTVAALTRMDPAAVRAAWTKVGGEVRVHPNVAYGAGQGGKGYRLVEPLPPVIDVDQVPVAGLISIDDDMTAELDVPAAVTAPDIEPTASSPEEPPPVDSPLAEVDNAVLRPGPLKIDTEVLDEWWASERPASLLFGVANDYMTTAVKTPHGQEKRAELSTLVGRLLGRKGFEPSVEVWLAAFSALSRGGRLDDQSKVVAVLSRATERMGRIDDEEPVQLPREFVRALGQLALEPGGPRHAFLDALARVSRDSVTSPELWSGIQWDNVSALSRGPAGSVLAKEPVLVGLVRKSVDQLVLSMASRSALSAFFSLPQFATEHLDAADVVAALERVARSDVQVSNWVGALRDGPEQQATRAERDRLRDRDRTRATTLAAREDEIAGLKDALRDAHMRLEELQNTGGALSDRELRHAQIDAARSVAQVAATVEGDGLHLEHDQLVQKVFRLVERFGLVPSASRGDDVPFDPEKHSAPGARPEVGETVHVARTGYIWNRDNETVVVLPALVTRLTP